MAAAGGYHLILMDLHMPEMGGLEATRILRREGIETPIVAMTADAMKGDRERCLAAGMDDYVAKPVRREAVLGVIRRHCGIDPGKKLQAVRRVLLVDRDEEQLRTMHDALRTLLPNAACRTTTNGVRAAAMLSSFAPDLVVLDLTVPEVDGRALLRFVRSEQRHAHTRVIVTTETEQTGVAPEVGRTEILPKPLDSEALLSAVKRLLSPSQAAAATSPEPSAAEAAALGLSPKLYEEILALFVEDTARRVEALTRALARGDAETISAEAHALKGAALSLRQEALAAAAERLEAKARDGDLAGVEGDLETLHHAFDRVRASVHALNSQ
jgi:CheY-like chemotaxis protein/HPt (histidine-containing phosphotransfer) domain-containing protein